ncbi:MKI67 FHA domain-interacting nucleolar phosphoprotein-like isoform X2 [Patella vulgata]|uniref:MKI67 FHA domain-interacting nucleolar phosphoprotein-like isoform X2 n=1 Tax=Patella vulgata TaxID=6465 RepID=UPI00217FF844|nr:MKI67 FHA domain-interacting nucleolar phosphoprotein-like isoform X2 [Patella vulgata]
MFCLLIDLLVAGRSFLYPKYEEGLKPDRGVIYLGHIPHGFYETEMKSFFSQFGRVTRLRLSRSKKTGNSKGYAFIEFEDAEVAEIAAETMNNYLMFERLLKCQVVTSEKVHPGLFIGSHRSFSKPKSTNISIVRHNSTKSVAKEKKLKLKAISKQQKKLAKLAELGVKLELNSILVSSPTTNKKGTVTPKFAMEEKKRVVDETPVQRIVPEKITTPEGELMVLMEDESETEISFKTPPNSIRSSKLTASGKRKKPAGDTPRTSKVGKKETIEPIELSLQQDTEVMSPEKAKEAIRKKDKPATKKAKKQTAKTTVGSAEKPRKMETRSSSRKITLTSKEKLKAPPTKSRRQK